MSSTSGDDADTDRAATDHTQTDDNNKQDTTVANENCDRDPFQGF